MRKILLTIFSFLFLIVLCSPTVWAQNKVKLTEVPAVKPVIKLPVFIGGSNQVVDKTIDSDLMMAGGTIKTVSTVNGDAYVAGGQIEVGGTINGNLIVTGGNITISGKVLKNVIVGGGQVKIDSPAKIGGYVLAGGGTVNLQGNFAGPVKVGGGTLIVGEKAIIDGNLEADVSKSEVAATSIIKGTKTINIHVVKQPEKPKNQWQQLGYVREIFSFLSKLVILLIFVKLFGQKIKQNIASNSFWPMLGWGLVVLIMTPILSLILMATVIAIPLALITMAVYLISIYLSGIVVSILVGHFISERKYLKTNSNYLQGSVGLLLLTILGLIPFVGGLIKFVVLLLGLGFIFTGLKMYFSKK